MKDEKIYLAFNRYGGSRKFASREQMDAFGRTVPDWSYYSTDKKAFNSLYKTGREAFVRDPIAWAFNRLHVEGKTQAV